MTVVHIYISQYLIKYRVSNSWDFPFFLLQKSIPWRLNLNFHGMEVSKEHNHEEPNWESSHSSPVLFIFLNLKERVRNSRVIIITQRKYSMRKLREKKNRSHLNFIITARIIVLPFRTWSSSVKYGKHSYVCEYWSLYELELPPRASVPFREKFYLAKLSTCCFEWITSVHIYLISYINVYNKSIPLLPILVLY